MWNLGFPELVVIFIVAMLVLVLENCLILVDPWERVGGVQEASNELKRTWEEEVRSEEEDLRKIQQDLD